MKRALPRIVPYRHSATSSYVIEGLRINGKRVRKFFATKGEAKTWLEQKKVQIENEGTAALTMPDALRIMAATCTERLLPYGKSIADATDFYIEYLKRTARSCTFAELVASFIEAKGKDGASGRYLQDLRTRFNRVSQDFAERKVATIEAREIDDWLRDLDLSPQSRNNFRTVLHALFGYAVDRDYCTVNPVTKTAKAKIVDKPPAIFTPVQTLALLSSATTDIRPALAIGFFAGLRQAEISRLDWKQVDLTRGFIEVTADNAKTARRRLVKIEANLLAWLTPEVQKSGSVYPPNGRNKTEAAREAGDKLLKEKNLGSLETWPDNGLRHSYASYHLAHFKDANRLALELGHGTTDMLFAHYRELVRPEDAEQYWKIAP